MLSILIVEDDADKQRAIEQALSQEPNLPSDTIVTTVTTAIAARNAMAAKRFDVVVLDIALPRVENSDVDSSAGVAILDELVARPTQYVVPTHIIGLTGFKEVLEQARGRFASSLLTLTLYEPGSSEWSDSLRARLRHIIGAVESIADAASEPSSDVCIICALQLELDAVRALDWKWKQVAVPGDDAIYWRGEYGPNGKKRLVYAGLAARMGMPAAACVASKMIHLLKPRFVCMPGIAAGIRGRVQLGDVVAADPCWDWGSGKWDLQKNKPRFAAAPYQIGLTPWLRERLRLIAANADWLRDAVQKWPGPALTDNVRMHLGPMASGAAVLADGETAKRVLEQNRQLLAIEMEAYGVFAAAEESAAPRPQAFAVKSIVDFADANKDDRFQAFASYTSVATLKHFAETYL